MTHCFGIAAKFETIRDFDRIDGAGALEIFWLRQRLTSTHLITVWPSERRLTSNLEIIIAERPREVAPFAALAPIVGEPEIAHDLFEARILARLGGLRIPHHPHRKVAHVDKGSTHGGQGQIRIAILRGPARVKYEGSPVDSIRCSIRPRVSALAQELMPQYRQLCLMLR